MQTAMTSAEYRAAIAPKKPATPRTAPDKGNTRASPRTPAVGTDTAKELPGAKSCPVRWQEAGAIFRQQHPGMSRIVVICHESDSTRVFAALESLNHLTTPAARAAGSTPDTL